MADWKQITARIRRARTGKDPVSQLTSLYEKTRDAMVAFELGKFLESQNDPSGAARWYATAAEKFRRSDWKTKAHEASLRLGGGEPFAATRPGASEPADSASEELAASPVPVPEPAAPFVENAEILETITGQVETDGVSEGAAGSRRPPHSEPLSRGRRRRGRRGGRNRRRSPETEKSKAAAAGATAGATSEEKFAPESAVPPLEPLADSASVLRGRYGDPGLSSRLSLLEMQFRRLLSCPPAKLSEADRAPAGPGVFVLTDEEMTTYYYVEACDTLRIAVAQLARGSAGRRGNAQLKSEMADHLGIAESRVAKYLSEHCVVRWLQLDEGASYFAHFAVAVLRPALNE